ncbi:MAG: alpha/beta hydrolase [Anaerolineae bacterium]|nr:alpha/beta hydrolase [Anaerolineae bacterium]
MPLLTTDPPYRGIIHYEVYGKGRPVLFLHGWLGSWQLWRKTIEHVGGNFRTYSLDFWGFGESRGAGRREETVQEFSVDAFVDMVGQFMDKLGIPKAAVIGHSMGGTVAMSCALRYPDRIVKAVAVGAPIDGDSLYLLLKLGGNSALASLGFTFMPVLRGIIGTYIRFAAKDGQALQRMVLHDFSQTTSQSFFQSIRTLHNTDLTEKIGLIQQPLMGIYGKRDIIVGHKQGYLMQRLVPHSRLEMYSDAGHFPMLDEPERFISDISTFLEVR